MSRESFYRTNILLKSKHLLFHLKNCDWFVHGNMERYVLYLPKYKSTMHVNIVQTNRCKSILLKCIITIITKIHHDCVSHCFEGYKLCSIPFSSLNELAIRSSTAVQLKSHYQARLCMWCKSFKFNI